MNAVETRKPPAGPPPAHVNPLPGNGRVTPEMIISTEREMVLHAFDELKKRGDGELRITTRRDPKTGHVEIVYCGVHQKADLESLRALYTKLRQQGYVTFGS